MQRLWVTVLFLLALAAPSLAGATAQEPDTLRIDGKPFALNTNPLELVILEKNWQPPKEASITTANWRGYTAVWEVRAGQLFLVDATIRVRQGAEPPKKQSIVSELFDKPAPIEARWYSGALIVPDGERTHYVHMGYGSTYSHYQLFRIEAGRVLEQLALTQAEFEAYRDRKFEEFRQTEEFRDAVEQTRKGGNGLSEEQTLQFLKSFMAERYLSR